MEEEYGVDGLACSTQDPRLIVLFSFLVLVVIYGLTVAVLLGRAPRRAGRRRRRRRRLRRGQLLYKATMKAFGTCTRLLVGLIRRAAVAAAKAAATIAPAQRQLLTTQQEIQSQEPAVKEELQSQEPAVKEELQSQEPAVKEELQSQEPAVKEDLQSQEPVVKEELQSQEPAVNEELQSQESTIDVQIQSHEEGLQFQHSTTEEGFLLVNIWNTGSLKQCSRNLIVCFKRINYPIQFEAAHSPNDSSCSSPTQFEYTYRDDLVQKNDNYQCQPIKSLFLLDQGDSYFIDATKLLQLEDMIHKQSVKPGSQQLLYDLFEENANVVDSFLCDFFNSVDLSIDACTCMVDCESAKRCVMNLKVMAGLLCLMKSELDEVVSFDQNLKDYYFALCARRPIQNLIDAADSVSKWKWPASDIYQMLVLYEAIADVLGAFSDPDGSDRIFQQMQINFEGIFDRIKIFIGANLNGSCEITHDRHPMTNFLLHSMELFENHNSIVRRIFVADATSSFGDLLLEMIRYWADELERHSDSYAEGRKYIFLLNNLTRFTWEIKKPLQILVSNSEYDKIIEFLESLINKYTAEYLDKCWAPVRKCVQLSSGGKPCLSSLDEFISEFEAVMNSQGTWVLETNLKNKLREQIKNYITPCFRTFLQKLRKKRLLRSILVIWKNYSGQLGKYMTTEQLDNYVDNIFESGT